MRLCGVIAEYNPFHNGHKLHLAKARERSGCDALCVVMAGAFTQRGEPAILDKWTRARMALCEGADLVAELPALFAVRTADWFATGGVQTLLGMGCEAISFGCETADPALLDRLCELTVHEPEEVRLAIRRGLDEGKPLARARGEALETALSLPAGTLDQPNLALALEYLRASDGWMQAIPVPRQGDYRDGETLGRLASASAIRQALRTGRDVSAAMPESALSLLREAPLADPRALDALLLHTLRGMSPEALSGICDVSEGLEHRMFREAQQAQSREDLIARVKCRRYTRARLSRLCAGTLLGLTKELAGRHPAPEYIRVLGFRREAAPVLRQIKECGTLPLATDPTRLAGQEMFEFERRATDLQGLCMPDGHRAAGRDFTEPLVII